MKLLKKIVATSDNTSNLSKSMGWANDLKTKSIAKEGLEVEHPVSDSVASMNDYDPSKEYEFEEMNTADMRYPQLWADILDHYPKSFSGTVFDLGPGVTNYNDLTYRPHVVEFGLLLPKSKYFAVDKEEIATIQNIRFMDYSYYRKIIKENQFDKDEKLGRYVQLFNDESIRESQLNMLSKFKCQNIISEFKYATAFFINENKRAEIIIATNSIDQALRSYESPRIVFKFLDQLLSLIAEGGRLYLTIDMMPDDIKDIFFIKIKELNFSFYHLPIPTYLTTGMGDLLERPYVLTHAGNPITTNDVYVVHRPKPSSKDNDWLSGVALPSKKSVQSNKKTQNGNKSRKGKRK